MVPDVYVLGPKAAYKSLLFLKQGYRNEYDPTRRFLLPMILSNEAFCHSMLTSAAAHRLQLIQSQNRPLSVVAACRSALSFHKGKTCQLVNQILANDELATADTTVGAVLYLAAAEVSVPLFLCNPSRTVPATLGSN